MKSYAIKKAHNHKIGFYENGLNSLKVNSFSKFCNNNEFYNTQYEYF